MVLQGRHVSHAAVPFLDNGAERIKMATSFRSRDPMAKDDSVLSKHVRKASDKKEVVLAIGGHRLEVLGRRIRGRG